MRRIAPRLAWLLLLGLTAACQSSDAAYRAVRAAKAVIERYVALQGAFDPAAADLILDEATITNLRHTPTGQSRKMTLSGVEYKDLLRSAMPLARARDDRSYYSDFNYEAQTSRRVRVRAERYSLLKEYASPISWIVVEEDNGAWMIAEEHSESRP